MPTQSNNVFICAKVNLNTVYKFFFLNNKSKYFYETANMFQILLVSISIILLLIILRKRDLRSLKA